MKKKLKEIFLYLLIFGTNNVYTMVTIHPASNKVVAKAGSKVVGHIVVTNPYDVPLKVLVQPEDWSNGKRLSKVEWLKIKKNEYILKPKKSKKVKFVATVPKDAKGDLISQIFFASLNPETAEGGVGIGTRVGSLLCITVEGTENVNIGIVNFEIKKLQENKYGFLIRAKNSGNVRLPTTGSLKIKDMRTKETKNYEIRPWVLLPEESWPFYVGMDGNIELNSGEYEAEAEIKYTFKDTEGKISKTIEFSITSNGEVKVNNNQTTEEVK